MQVTLKTIEEEHVEIIRNWASQEELSEFFRRYAPLFVWDRPDLIVQAMATCYLIRFNGEIVGLASLSNFDPQHKKVELGLLMDKNKVSENRSFVYIQACRQICDYIYDYLGYEKIYSLLLTHRDKVASVMCSNGFHKEGKLRKNVFWRGEFHDENVYSMLKEDYYKHFRR